MKITKSQLKEIIKEEVSRLQKKTVLENEKKAITRELRTLNEEAEVAAKFDVEVPDWLVGKLEQVHTKPGQGSIFAKPIKSVVELVKSHLSKMNPQEVEKIANSTGTVSLDSSGIGYDLVLPMDKAKALKDAQQVEVEKVEGPNKIKVPAIKTSEDMGTFSTGKLTIIVRPKKDESGNVLKGEYIVLSAFPGNPDIPRASEWAGKYAVIIPGAQMNEEAVTQELFGIGKKKKEAAAKAAEEENKAAEEAKKKEAQAAQAAKWAKITVDSLANIAAKSWENLDTAYDGDSFTEAIERSIARACGAEGNDLEDKFDEFFKGRITSTEKEVGGGKEGKLLVGGKEFCSFKIDAGDEGRDYGQDFKVSDCKLDAIKPLCKELIDKFKPKAAVNESKKNNKMKITKSQKNNKMKITKSQLKEIIKEEASKYVYSKSLIEKRDIIKEAISKINEGEDISEEEMNELFGNFGAGLKSVGKMIGGKAKEAAGKVTDAAKEAAGKATDAVQKAAGDVKQAYQSGVDKAKYEKAQKEIANIAQQIQGLKQKMKNDEAQLQAKYAELTGGKPFKGAVHNPVMSEGKVIWDDGLDDIILV